MVTCCDTSFLFSVYGNDCHSATAHGWLRQNRAVVTLSPLNAFEFANAIRFAEFRKVLSRGAATILLAQLEKDLADGRLRIGICNLLEISAEANRLSATYTIREGHRSFDILHVAAARHMGATKFLSFDENQRKLAYAEKLDVRL